MIKENLVFIEDGFEDDKKCLEFMVDKVDEAKLLSNKTEYLNSVYEREKQLPTSVGFEVAIPHGMSDAVKETFVVFLKSKKPICWGKDKVASRLIFLIGVPKTLKNKVHLKVISQISRYLIDDSFRKKLLECKDPKEAFEILNNINKDIEKEMKN